MASGLKYEFGICGKCHYSAEEVIRDNPGGASNLEATAVFVHTKPSGKGLLIVLPHRSTCIFHTNQRSSDGAQQKATGNTQPIGLQS